MTGTDSHSDAAAGARDRAVSGDATVAVDGGALRARGAWTVSRLRPAERSLARLRWPDGERGRVVIDLGETTALDTAGAWLLRRTIQRLEADGHEVSVEGLDENGERILALVRGAAEDEAPPRRHQGTSVLETIGRKAASQPARMLDFLAFVGEMTAAAARTLVRPWRIRWTATFHALEAAGPRALPIVGLLAFLLGVVIAYQGGMALQRYGATRFVADMVGLSMLRELAPILTAIIVAGRTGSAYTAHLGTMKISEEVDALETMSISPMELLVLPRLFALMLALPLLTVFADVCGVLGGMLMASGAFDIGFSQFLGRLNDEATFRAYLMGVGKAPVFAAVIASVGCHRGFSVSGSAESVGRQTTLSVVQSIFLVIVIDAAFAVAFSYVGL